jgi:hypothetical protein
MFTMCMVCKRLWSKDYWFLLLIDRRAQDLAMKTRFLSVVSVLLPACTMMRIVPALACCALLSGCSVYMAATQPEAKNITLFKIGTPKSLITAEFGTPQTTIKRNGKEYEIYAFTTGSHVGVKAAKTAVWIAADILTLGLAEVVGTPVETLIRSKDMAYEVSFDKNDLVDHVAVLKK